MAYILNIDSSTQNCSVALFYDTKLVSLREIYVDKSASSLINTFCESVCVDYGIALSNLDAIGVGIGPGSYTGLRIAVSTVKGLAFGLEKPIIAVPNLHALAWSVQEMAIQLNALICPMIDARRMEVFTSIFDSNLETILPTQAMILEASSFHETLNNSKILFIGDGSNKFKSVINHPNAIFIDNIHTSAKHLGVLSFVKYQKQQFEDIAYLEPYYLKQFVSTAKTIQ